MKYKIYVLILEEKKAISFLKKYLICIQRKNVNKMLIKMYKFRNNISHYFFLIKKQSFLIPSDTIFLPQSINKKNKHKTNEF